MLLSQVYKSGRPLAGPLDSARLFAAGVREQTPCLAINVHMYVLQLLHTACFVLTTGVCSVADQCSTAEGRAVPCPVLVRHHCSCGDDMRRIASGCASGEQLERDGTGRVLCAKRWAHAASDFVSC